MFVGIFFNVGDVKFVCLIMSLLSFHYFGTPCCCRYKRIQLSTYDELIPGPIQFPIRDIITMEAAMVFKTSAKLVVKTYGGRGQ